MKNFVLAVSGLLCSVTIAAQEQFYIAVDLGSSRFDVGQEFFNGQFAGFTEDEAFENIALGWEFHESWSLEVGAEIDHAFDFFDNLFTDSSLEKETSFHGSYLKVAKRFDLGGVYFTPALGLMSWELNADPGENSGDVIKDGTAPFIEILFERPITERFSMGLKFRSMNEDEFDVNSYGLNLSFRF
ncbi:hypothetical protein [Pleionea sp. CnH1-48]|uniref:hypothetical protein n=1 Tax=Pleionea sp. CnH1-48 TaxID=2954494 RepID=UPI002096D798|nr:hypothetical protein [Pleionea sp. CnH1-48]MCO7226265.1 hypothetical protein [Pleionea sp. CnH1-48]